MRSFMRSAWLLVFMTAAALFVPKLSMAQEDNENVKWWWAKYQAIGDHDRKWDALVLDGIRLWQDGKRAESPVPLKKATDAGCNCPIVKFIWGRNAQLWYHDSRDVRKH